MLFGTSFRHDRFFLSVVIQDILTVSCFHLLGFCITFAVRFNHSPVSSLASSLAESITLLKPWFFSVDSFLCLFRISPYQELLTFCLLTLNFFVVPSRLPPCFLNFGPSIFSSIFIQSLLTVCVLTTKYRASDV